MWQRATKRLLSDQETELSCLVFVLFRSDSSSWSTTNPGLSLFSKHLVVIPRQGRS